MKPSRPGRRDTRFDPGENCPACAKPLTGLNRLSLHPNGMGASLLPIRLECGGCSAVWELASPDERGAVQIRGFSFLRVDTGEQN